MKKFKEIKKGYLFFLVSIFFFSCETHVQEEIEIIESSICDPNTSYELTIEPIIANNCLECHAGSQSPNLSSYSGVSTNADRIRFQVANRFMPQGGSLTNEEIELILCWVDNGALNN